MDLLSQRYASPSFILDDVIADGGFSDWIDFFMKKYYEELSDKALWELYVNKDMSERSFEEFKNAVTSSLKSDVMEEAEKEEIIRNSEDILNNFVPKEGDEHGTI